MELEAGEQSPGAAHVAAIFFAECFLQDLLLDANAVQCSSACQSDQVLWTYEPIENGAVLDAEFPVPRPSHYDAGL